MINQFPIPLPPLPTLPYISSSLIYPALMVLAVLVIFAIIKAILSLVKDFPAALAIIGLVLVFVIVVWIIFGDFSGVVKEFQSLTGPIFRWK